MRVFGDETLRLSFTELKQKYRIEIYRNCVLFFRVFPVLKKSVKKKNYNNKLTQIKQNVH